MDDHFSGEAGELTGTQYTDVYQQGRLAAAAATVLATGGVSAKSITQQAHLLMPYLIATKDGFISRVFFFNFVPWLYVALRVVHSLVQVSVNAVTPRFLVFSLSTIVLAVMVVRELLVLFGG